MGVILTECRVRKCLPRHRLNVLWKMSTLKPDDSTKMNVHKVTKTIVTSPLIYKPVGPYSQAILADKTLYVSGVLGMDPQAQLVCGGAEAQARQALNNLRHVLEAGGASLESVVKTTILLARMDDYQAVNQVYAKFQNQKILRPRRTVCPSQTVCPRQTVCPSQTVCPRHGLPKTDTLSKMSPDKADDTTKTNDHKVTKTIVTSPNIYKPVGPYSQAILADKTLYVSGVLGMDPQAQLVDGGAEEQARKALENLRHVLEAGGASLESVVKTTILLARMDDFQAVNQVYAEFFPKDFPARATFQVGKLPLDAAVEIEAIALSGDLVVAEAGPCPCAKI